MHQRSGQLAAEQQQKPELAELDFEIARLLEQRL